MKGQSLLETVIAIGIILIGIVPLVALTTMTARAGRLAAEQTIATELASEGIEVVRNIRDSNWLEGEAWNNGLSDGQYVIQFTTSPPNWNLQSGNWISTPVLLDRFKRLIVLHSLADGGLEVTSEVRWQGRSYQLIEYLYDWRP